MQEKKYNSNIIEFTKHEEKLRKNERKYEHKPIKSTLIVRNLNENVRSSDISEWLGLNSTEYLRKNCKVSVPLNNETKKSLGYAYLTVPKHVYDQIIQLNGIEFKGHKIFIEDAVVRPKDHAKTNNENHTILSPNRFAPLQPTKENDDKFEKSLPNNERNSNYYFDFNREIINNPSINKNPQNLHLQKRRPPVVVKQHPEREKSFGKLRTVPGEDTYSQTVNREKKSQITQKCNVLIFSDSITSKIKIYDFNREFKNGKAKHMFFPGSTSEQVLQYLEVNLKINKPDAVLFHVGINDVLNDSSQYGLENVINNLQEMVGKCRKYDVKQIFISGLVCSKRVPYSILENLNMKIREICLQYDLIYIDNSNIKVSHLYKDNLHLLKSGRDILISNFVACLNRYFLTEGHILRYA